MARHPSEARLAYAGVFFLCAVPVTFFWLGSSAERVPAPDDRRLTRVEPVAPLVGARPPIPLAPAVRTKATEVRRESSLELEGVAPIRNEESILEELRRLKLSNPRQSLSLARRSLQQFPQGPSSAERSWYEARALVELGRFGEARQVAERMRAAEPDSPFTADAQRHLLFHPFGLPPR